MSTNPDFSKMTGDMYRAWESSMTQWWDTVLESPAFLDAMGKNLSQQTRSRRQWEDGVDKTMENLHLPSRSDVVRLARIATLLEDKVLGLEDQVLEMQDRMAAMEKETIKARIEAAEAQLRLTAVLERIEGKLDASEAPAAEPAKKPATRRRSTKASQAKSTEQ